MTRTPVFIVSLLVGLALIMVVFAAQAQYPNCGFNCRANDVIVSQLYVDVPDTCSPGEVLTAGLFVRLENGTNSDRYAVRFLGDLYVAGVYEQSFDECVSDTMPPGTSTLLLASVSWSCGETLEFRDLVVSWSANPETCGEIPTCAERKTKCSLKPSIQVAGTPISVDFTSTAPACQEEAVSFSGQASGGTVPYSYNWDFGDGASGTTANPEHIYSSDGTYEVTMAVTDASGKSNYVSRSIDIFPDPQPAASNTGPYCPGDTIELFADGGSSYSWTGPAGFSSNEQNPMIPGATADSVGMYVVAVTNVGSCTGQASTTVEMDSTKPVLSVPPDTTVECGAETDPMVTGQASATDNTDPAPSVAYSDEVIADCGNTATITRTWTATDSCGNSSSQPQRIEVVDTTPPILTISSALFECDGIGNKNDIDPWLESAAATDTCGDVTITNDFSGLSGDCPGIGLSQVTFTATDECGNATQRTATIEVLDTTPPDAREDSASTDENFAIVVDVLANDLDVCDTGPVITSVEAPDFGEAEVVDNEVRYTPAPGFSGTETFSYTIADCSGNSALGLVEITVLPVNDPPQANQETMTAEEDTPLSLKVTATDPDGDALTYSILSSPSNGTVSGLDPATGQLTYNPSPNYNGPDSFTFQVCDPSEACDTAMVSITVEAVPDAPIADSQTLTTPEDNPLPVTVSATDADDDPLTYGVISDPSNGTISEFDPVTGTLVYTPDQDFYGTDSFVFEACDPDPHHGCAQATVTISVTPVNDPPRAQDQNRVTAEDTATGFFALAISDPDNTLAEIVCDCQVPPQNGTVERGPNHTVNYMPNPDFHGTDTFRYEVCDPSGLCASAQVYIDITPVNDPPVAKDDTVTLFEDELATIIVMENDLDPDGNLDPSSVFVLVTPSHGRATVNASNGDITYEPDPNFNGPDTFTYEICDTNGVCDSALVVLTILPVNDEPIADAGGPYEGLAGKPITLDASQSADPDVSDTLEYRWDFNSDGLFDTEWLTKPTINHVWNRSYQGTITLEVRDVRNNQPTGSTNLADGSINIRAGTRLEVLVFVDEDNNGTKEGGEEVLQGIPISLDGATPQISNSAGRVIFVNVEPTEHNLAIPSYGLQALLQKDFEIAETEKKVTTAPGQSQVVFFPVTKTVGLLSGIVYVDVNGNSKLDEEDRPAPGLIVRLDGNEEEQVITGKEGTFAWERVAYGQHQLIILGAARSKGQEPLSLLVPITVSTTEKTNLQIAWPFKLPPQKGFLQVDIEKGQGGPK
jgi:PKD repeat protein